MVEDDGQAQVGRAAARRASMTDRRESPAMLKYGLQRGRHRFRKERDGIGKVALPGAVLTDQKRRVVKLYLLLGQTAKALQHQAA